MTAIVGVLCSDGVVVGADSVATFGAAQYSTIEQQTEKLSVIGNDVIVAGTGSVGMNQRFCAVLEASSRRKLFARHSHLEIAKALSRATIDDMDETYLRPGGYGAFLAFPCRDAPFLCEFGVNDFQPEFKDHRLWYGSVGSAQRITDPFLGFIRSVFWEDGPPSVYDAVLAVTWTLQHAIDLNTGGVNGPIRVAVLEKAPGAKYRARVLDPAELAEHQQNIRDAHAALREFKARQKSGTGEAVPDVPKLGS